MFNFRTIYEKLSGAFVDEQRQIYSNRVDEIAPSIRYCAYSIGDESAIQDLRQMRGKTGLGDNMMMQLDVSEIINTVVRHVRPTDVVHLWCIMFL